MCVGGGGVPCTHTCACELSGQGDTLLISGLEFSLKLNRGASLGQEYILPRELGLWASGCRVTQG